MPRIRKRVCATPRAPDGSAFQKCIKCCRFVAIALVDMHECDSKQQFKRFRGVLERENIAKQSFSDQPRSPFRMFMESFLKTCERGDQIDMDRKGFEVWQNMSKEERKPYVSGAEMVNSAYLKTMIDEINYIQEVQDEANSAVSVNIGISCREVVRG